MKDLTEKQKMILDFIEDFTNRKNASPSVNEIAEHFDIKPSTAFAHLSALRRKNEISRSAGNGSFSLLRRPGRICGMICIPLVGRVIAGLPVDNPECLEGEIWVSSRYGTPDKLFALKVQGESMRDLGIFENDILVAVKDAELKPGDIVVALTSDGETTVKSYYPSGNNIELRPANPDYPVRVFPKSQLAVQGKVAALMRDF